MLPVDFCWVYTRSTPQARIRCLYMDALPAVYSLVSKDLQTFHVDNNPSALQTAFCW